MKISTFMRNSVLTIAAVLVLPLSVYAAPAVSSISGTVTHGATVTIAGSGFGTKTPVAPNLWDTVSNQYSLSNGSVIPVGGSHPWQENGYFTTNGTVFDSTAGDQRNSKSAACYKLTGNDPTLRGHPVPGATELYISFWYKSSVDIQSGNQSSKIMRLNGGSYTGDAGNETFSWDPAVGDYVYDNNYCPTPGGNDISFGDGNWHFMEGYFNQSTLKTVILKTDGKTMTTLNTSGCGSWNWDYVWLMGDDRGGVSPSSPTIWMGDIYIDSTRARVMICNASTFSASTHCEMQIPNTTWQDNQLQINVNQGSFADSSTAYLYVVDASGNVSAANTITFGASGSQGTQGTTRPDAPLLQ